MKGAVKWRGVNYGAGGEAYEVPSDRFPQNLVNALPSYAKHNEEGEE